MEESPFPPGGSIRAPSQAQWDRLSIEERSAVLATLGPMPDSECSPPEGTRHSGAKISALDVLRGYFRQQKRPVFIATELTIYYPEAPRFAPDLMVVFDVGDHDRQSYVVASEGKGLDFVMEVHVGGNRKKDAERNVAFYARLGIPEYFVYDRSRDRLLGYQLPSPSARKYQAILPQGGVYPSQVLGLGLQLLDGRLRFFAGHAELLETVEWAERLERVVADLERRVDEEATARAEEAKARAEEAKARAEEAKARAEAERRVAQLQEELDRLKAKR